MTNHARRQSYVLATGKDGAARLRLLDQIFGEDTYKFLIRAGLSRGMKVADVGCGSGLVSIWMSRFVGTSGSVVAIDGSPAQIEIAAQNAIDTGSSNIKFYELSAYELAGIREQFDLVYSRFLMCHLTDPLRALKSMRSILRVGGILVCEDHDNGGIFSEPSSSAYQRLVVISNALNHVHGFDSAIGLRLPRLFIDAGVPSPQVQVNQVTKLRGVHKRFWEVTLREASPAILAAGLSTQDELDSLCHELRAIADDESTLVMLARVTQVSAVNGDHDVRKKRRHNGL